MPPIRKGDGTPVTAKGISQIRTGDGRILFDGVAIPDSVVDNFEDEDADPPGIYNGLSLSDVYSGDLASFSRISGGITGNTVLANEADAGDLIHSQPDDGLNRYPEPGDTVEFIINNDPYDDGSNCEPSVCFMIEDDANPSGYVFHFLPDTDRISISSTDDINSLSSSSADDIAIDSTLTELSSAEPFWFKAKLPSPEDDEISFEVFEDDDGEQGDSIGKISANNDDHVDQAGTGHHSTSDGGLAHVDIVRIDE